MVYCQAFGCSNRSEKNRDVSFHQIPDPQKKPDLCKKWLIAIKTTKLEFKKYFYKKDNVVCSDHFREDDFEGSMQARLTGSKVKRRLKPDAVPSIFSFCPPPKHRESSAKRIQNAEAQKYIKSVLQQPDPTAKDVEVRMSHDQEPSTSRKSILHQPDHTASKDDVEGISQLQEPSSSRTYVQLQSVVEHPDPTGNTDHGEMMQNPPSPQIDVQVPSPSRMADVISAPWDTLESDTTILSSTEDEPNLHDPAQCIQVSARRKGRSIKRKQSPRKKLKSDDQAVLCQKRDASSQTLLTVDTGTQWPPDFNHINLDHKYARNLLPLVWPCCAHSSHQFRQDMPTAPSPRSSTQPVNQTTPSLVEPSQPAEALDEGSAASLENDSENSPNLIPPSEEKLSSPESLSPMNITESSQPPSPISLARLDSPIEPIDDEPAETSLTSPESSLSDGSSSSSYSPPTSSDESSYKASSDDDSSDSEFDDEPEEISFCKDEKFLVFGSQLDQLFFRMKCSECDSGHISDLKKYSTGTMLTVEVICVCGNLVMKWTSQPLIGKQPVGNLLTAAAVVLSGKTYEQLRFFSELLNLQFMGKKAFYGIQSALILPAINHFFHVDNEEQQQALRDSAAPVTIIGDGRCDSPGYSAKYCTYTCMNSATKKIATMSLVQVTEVTSSVAMEKEGCRRSLDHLLQKGITVATMATDRHTGIRKMMRENYPAINHQFDVWHLTKSITKKLTAISKRKDCGEIGAWIKAITNHVWWSAQHCGGDPEMLVEMVQSITHHICDIHSWNSAEKFKECAHEQLTEEESLCRKWLTPGSKAHQALQDVLFDKRLMKDIKQLTQACHTGSLEVYHSLYLKYCPKRLHFDFPSMLGRAQLAVLDHNNNTEVKQAVVQAPKKGSASKGSLRYKYVFSKQTQDWIRKKVTAMKDYTYLWELMVAILQAKSGQLQFTKPDLPQLPPNIAKFPRPSKEDLDARATSRFM